MNRELLMLVDAISREKNVERDVVFAAATGKKPVDPLFGLTELGMVAANTVARAVARGVHGATALPFLGALPAWSDRFG